MHLRVIVIAVCTLAAVLLKCNQADNQFSQVIRTFNAMVEDLERDGQRSALNRRGLTLISGLWTGTLSPVPTGRNTSLEYQPQSRPFQKPQTRAPRLAYRSWCQIGKSQWRGCNGYRATLLHLERRIRVQRAVRINTARLSWSLDSAIVWGCCL